MPKRPETRSARRIRACPMNPKPLVAFENLLMLSLASWILTGSTLAQPAPGGDEYARNWPGFRGPTHNGTSPTATPPVEWGENRNVKWKVKLPGSGNTSSPVIWGNRIFVLTAIPQPATGRQRPTPPQPADGRRGGRSRAAPPTPTQFVTLCYDRETGRELWQQLAVEATPHQGTHPDHSYASASPCTDGQRVYAHFGSRGLYCYDMDGNLQWKRDDLGKMQTRNGFGEGSSPFLYGETIVVPWDHEGQSYVMALDTANGSTRWKADRDEPSNWVTPVVVNLGGRDVLVTGGENHARAYDLQSGDEIWYASGFTSRPISSPVTFHDTVMLASARQGFFVSAMKLDGQGDLNTGDGVVWSSQQVAPDVPSLLLSGDRLYFMRGSTGVLNCWDAATGQPKYSPQRLPGISAVYASPVAADGKVIIVGRDGTSVVVEDSDTFRVLSTNQLDDRIDATPALAGNDIILRGKTFLYCISAEKDPPGGQ